jgi:hypothetical protein
MWTGVDPVSRECTADRSRWVSQLLLLLSPPAAANALSPPLLSRMSDWTPKEHNSNRVLFCCCLNSSGRIDGRGWAAVHWQAWAWGIIRDRKDPAQSWVTLCRIRWSGGSVLHQHLTQNTSQLLTLFSFPVFLQFRSAISRSCASNTCLFNSPQTWRTIATNGKQSELKVTKMTKNISILCRASVCLCTHSYSVNDGESKVISLKVLFDTVIWNETLLMYGRWWWVMW